MKFGNIDLIGQILRGSDNPYGLTQIQSVDYSTEFSNSTKDSEQFIFEKAITPKYADSYIIAVATIQGLDNNTSGRLYPKLRYSTSSGVITGTILNSAGLANTGTSTTGLMSCYLFGVVALGNTNTTYFAITGVKGDNADTWYFQRFGLTSKIYLLEFAKLKG
ncbi:MAG: hypothetical protein ACTSPD_09700 [Promethearchaeota archaeon]